MKKLFTLMLITTVTTVSSAQTSIFKETFEGGAIPSGWTQGTKATDGGWKVGDNSQLQNAQSFPIPAHTIFAATNDATCNCNKRGDTLKTPAISLSSYVGKKVALKFDSYFLAAGGGIENALVLASTTNGLVWETVQTIKDGSQEAWQTRYFDISKYAGMSVKLAVVYSDAGYLAYGMAIDNFEVFEPLANDAQLAVIKPKAGSPKAYGKVESQLRLSGTIFNGGGNTITSVTIKYSDGSKTYSDTRTGLTIASFKTFDFEHTTPFTIPKNGPNDITMWVELTSDGNKSNDTLTTVIQGVPFMPKTMVYVEEATGTWCGWCPRGTVYMDSLELLYPETSIGVAVHNGDPMSESAYDAGMGTMIAGYPSILVNRSTLDDPSNVLKLYDKNKDNFGFADFKITSVLTEDLKLATDVEAHFATELSGDYRLALVLTEDNVTGTTSGYDQHNYYSGGGAGPMAGWEDLDDPVPAEDMVYNHVARKLVGGFQGQSGSLASSIALDSTYKHTFNTKLKSDWNPENMHVIVFLIDVTNNTILNGAKIDMPAIIKQAPQADFIVSKSDPVEDESIDFTDQSTGSPDIWMWDFGDGTTSGEQNPSKIYENPGTYTVKLKVVNSAGADSMVKAGFIQVSAASTGIALTKDTEITIYPNPANQQTSVSCSTALGNAASIKVFNALGQMVDKAVVPAGANKATINTSKLNAGLYTVQIESNGASAMQNLNVIH